MSRVWAVVKLVAAALLYLALLVFVAVTLNPYGGMP